MPSPKDPAARDLGTSAGAVLADLVGERTRFSIEPDAMLGVTRSYRSFSAATDEVKNSRIYAGIHFRSACDDGQTLERSVVAYVLENALRRAGGH